MCTRRAFAVAAIVVTASRFLAAQATPWPAPRGGGHAAAFDTQRGVTWMYGDRARDATTLWAWNGTAWTSFNEAGPGLRRHIKLAYDAARDRLVLFGGLDDSGQVYFGDTWEWNGARWTQVATDGPSPRSSYALVYHPGTRLTYLFGGLTANGPTNDTWSWDGRRWTKVTDEGPSARGEAGVAFDAGTSQILLAGGMAYAAVTTTNGRTAWTLRRDVMPGDTWRFDGTTWRQTDAAPLRLMAPLAASPSGGPLLRIAGESDAGLHGDLWSWTGTAWRRLAGADIPARHGPAAALDTRRQRLVVFGGSLDGGQASAELWEFDGQRWRDVRP